MVARRNCEDQAFVFVCAPRPLEDSLQNSIIFWAIYTQCFKNCDPLERQGVQIAFGQAIEVAVKRPVVVDWVNLAEFDNVVG